jgi:hypothetical protein
MCRLLLLSLAVATSVVHLEPSARGETAGDFYCPNQMDGDQPYYFLRRGGTYEISLKKLSAGRVGYMDLFLQHGPAGARSVQIWDRAPVKRGPFRFQAAGGPGGDHLTLSIRESEQGWSLGNIGTIRPQLHAPASGVIGGVSHQRCGDASNGTLVFAGNNGFVVEFSVERVGD